MRRSRKLPYKPRLARTERRELIEQAAAQLFAERGYADTSLDDVAAAAGVSRPVIYDHFATKRGLHDALMARHLRELMEFIAARTMDEHGGLESRLRAGLSAFFEFMEADPYAWRIVMREPLSGGIAPKAGSALQSEMTAGLAALIQQAAEESGVELEAERITRFAESYRWICAGLATWWWDHREVSREEIVETIIDLTWTGLGQMSQPRRGSLRAGDEPDGG
jgi:AcrR family transcriptional regulator